MKRAICFLLAVLATGGCAALPAGEPVAHDPWERPNRTLYGINDAIDKVTTRPVARAYNKVLPQFVRQGVTNFSTNLFAPRSAVNNFLQGKSEGGFTEIMRFAINSTIGIGGLFDIAARAGLQPQPEDFGQTAAVWGVPDGPFVMLPFLGPRTLRDTILMPLDMMADPLYHYDNSSARDPIYVLRIINLRARLLSVEELLDDSKDPYVTVRESYLQNRQFEVYDGNPPSDDDDLFDEFFEDEDY